MVHLQIPVLVVAVVTMSCIFVPVTSAQGGCIEGQFSQNGPDCTVYQWCVHGTELNQQCPSGLYWNPQINVCDWPRNVQCPFEGATIKATPTSSSASTATSTSISSTTFSTAPSTRSRGRSLTLPADIDTTTTDISPTPSSKSTRATSSTDKTTKSTKPSGCIEGQLSQSSLPDCSVYQRCTNGVQLDQQCPSGLYWNSHINVCDWPRNVQCPFEASSIASTPSSSRKSPTLPAAFPSTERPKSTRATNSTAKTIKPSKYKVICYYTNWSWYRPGDGKYGPSDIDIDLCTHIIFGFATLDPTQLTMKVFDTWSDTDEYGPKLYAKVTALKANEIKVLIALGGWNDSQGDKYSRLVNNPAARKHFVDTAVIFIEQYGFDGLDLDWEYPKCWQVNCNAGPSSDKEGFSAWVSELRAAFNPRGWLLSAAVSPSKTVIDSAYDVPSISRDLDWIGVMSYDYHGHWDKKTGHVAPLYHHPEAENEFFNVNYTLNYWIQMGAEPSKIIMGFPLYGQSFTLTDPISNNGLNAPSSGTGLQGPFTRQAGFLAYYEICKNIAEGGWTVVRDHEGTVGPYAHKDNQWVSFDDVAMTRKKVKVAKALRLGGAMVWALDLDDFRNRCECVSYPLLKTINHILRKYPAPSSKKCLSSSSSNKKIKD